MTVRLTFSWMRLTRAFILIAALGCLGAYVSTYLYRTAFQIYANWRFDDAETAAASSASDAVPVASDRAASDVEVNPRTKPAKLWGTLGRIYIPRLHLSPMVEEGVEDGILRRAVGHIPGTSMPGQQGNVGLAGHRDSFFRGLKDIRPDDEIDLTTSAGSFKYVVKELMVVDPANVAVLASTAEPTLTVVTCYPFSYIGSAPRRFIVRATQILRLSADSHATARPRE